MKELLKMASRGNDCIKDNLDQELKLFKLAFRTIFCFVGEHNFLFTEFTFVETIYFNFLL